MAETEMKQKVVKGLLWKLLENGGAQGVQFVIAINLARLLTPAQYGSGTETEGRQGGFFIGLLF